MSVWSKNSNNRTFPKSCRKTQPNPISRTRVMFTTLAASQVLSLFRKYGALPFDSIPVRDIFRKTAMMDGGTLWLNVYFESRMRLLIPSRSRSPTNQYRQATVLPTETNMKLARSQSMTVCRGPGLLIGKPLNHKIKHKILCKNVLKYSRIGTWTDFTFRFQSKRHCHLKSNREWMFPHKETLGTLDDDL